MMAQLTVITSRRPAVVSKTARRGPTVRSSERAAAWSSTATPGSRRWHRSATWPFCCRGLARRRRSPSASRATAAAGSQPGGARPTKIGRRHHDANPGRLCLARGAGILMLDHDPDGVSLSRDELVDVIRSAAPGLADAAMLWWPSASSHICDEATGEDLTGLRGQRIYLMVREAADIPRAGAVLVDRLWAAGHGRIVVSAAGAALERCPVDGSVWQPERLDFAAGAVCGEGLVQRRGIPVLIPGSTEVDRHQRRAAGRSRDLHGGRGGPPLRQGGCRGGHRSCARGVPRQRGDRAARARGPR